MGAPWAQLVFDVGQGLRAGAAGYFGQAIPYDHLRLVIIRGEHGAVREADGELIAVDVERPARGLVGPAERAEAAVLEFEAAD